jgi:hypothetical protein
VTGTSTMAARTRLASSDTGNTNGTGRVAAYGREVVRSSPEARLPERT